MNRFQHWMVIAIAGTMSGAFSVAQNASVAPGSHNGGSASTIVSTTRAEQGCSPALFSQQELMENREVQIASTELYRGALTLPKVSAMWITYKDGRFGFVRWSREGMSAQTHWKGPLPECTVAVVHTHPKGTSTLPDSEDYDLANGRQRADITVPVYVLHWTQITKAVPGSFEVVYVRDMPWLDEFMPKNGDHRPVIAQNVYR